MVKPSISLSVATERGGTRATATSKMEHFVIIVKFFQDGVLCDNS